MLYKIYCLESPDHMKVTEPDGYYLKTKYRQVLVELDDVLDTFHSNTEFETFEEAINFIEKENEKLKGLKLTILPIVEVGYD
jgi:hypothetical protein